jgi:hypothetical protein
MVNNKAIIYDSAEKLIYFTGGSGIPFRLSALPDNLPVPSLSVLPLWRDTWDGIRQNEGGLCFDLQFRFLCFQVIGGSSVKSITDITVKLAV